MSNQIWKAMWERNDIAFHQPIVSPLLQRFLPQLNVPSKGTILVPLCGKSLDMDYLADSGYRVIGIELSYIAIQAYFEARKVKPVREKRGNFVCWSNKNIEIWCGDIFDLTYHLIGHIQVLYDCTSLTAFPAIIRPLYVRHFNQTLSHQSQILLITTESPDQQQLQSVLTIDNEVKTLYEKLYHIKLLYGQNSLRQDPAFPNEPDRIMEEKVYLINNQ